MQSLFKCIHTLPPPFPFQWLKLRWDSDYDWIVILFLTVSNLQGVIFKGIFNQLKKYSQDWDTILTLLGWLNKQATVCLQLLQEAPASRSVLLAMWTHPNLFVIIVHKINKSILIYSPRATQTHAHQKSYWEHNEVLMHTSNSEICKHKDNLWSQEFFEKKIFK